MNELMAALKRLAQEHHLTVLGDRLVPVEAIENFADRFADWDVMPPHHIKISASEHEARSMILLCENYLQAKNVRN